MRFFFVLSAAHFCVLCRSLLRTSHTTFFKWINDFRENRSGTMPKLNRRITSS